MKSNVEKNINIEIARLSLPFYRTIHTGIVQLARCPSPKSSESPIRDVSRNVVATQYAFLRGRFRVGKKCAAGRLDNANTRSRLFYGRLGCLSTPVIVRLSYPRTSELFLIGSNDHRSTIG